MAMEIPVINRIGDFEARISSINDPTIFSQMIAFSGTGKLQEAFSFWKWGALILAFLASFTTLIHRFKVLILRLRNLSPSLPSLPILDDYDSDSDFSCSSSDEEDEESDDEEEEEESNSTWRFFDEDFRVRGTSYDRVDSKKRDRNDSGIRRRRNSSIGDLFSWRPDLSALSNTSVVKLWDQNAVASFLGRRGSVSESPNAVVLTAGKRANGNGIELRAWDSRAGFNVPAILAEWKEQPRRLLGKIVGVGSGGVDKIYVRDDVSRELLTVGDLRKVNGPLTDVTDSDINKWLDADSVIRPEISVRKSKLF